MPSCLADPSLWCILSTGQYPPSVKSHIKCHGRPNPMDWLPPRQAYLCNLRSRLSWVGLWMRMKDVYTTGRRAHSIQKLVFFAQTHCCITSQWYVYIVPPYQTQSVKRTHRAVSKNTLLWNVSIQQPWASLTWKPSYSCGVINVFPSITIWIYCV